MGVIQKGFMDLLKPYQGLPREVYIIFIARIINAMGVLVFPLLTLILTKKLGLSNAEAGFWLSISGLMWGPASLIGGKLTDIIGRKKIIILFDTLGALAYLSISLLEPSMTLVYFIMVASFFMGVAQPAHDALIADLTTPENRNGAYSLTYLGFNMGFIIGPILGGLLFENYFRFIFIIDGITALLAVLLVWFFIGETIERTKEEIGDNRELEKRVDGSIFEVLFARPILIYFALASFGFSFVYSQWSFMMPIHVENNFIDQGAVIYGRMGAFNGFIVILFTPILTSLLMKQNNIRRIILGGILYTFGFGMLGFISTQMAFFISVFIFTLGEILVTISTVPFIVNHTPASHRGRMNSVLPLLIGFGHTLGPIVMGNVLELSSIEMGWKFVGLVMLLFTLLMIMIEKMDKRNEAKSEDKSKNVITVN